MKKIAIVVTLLLLGIISLVLYNNHFDMTISEATIENKEGKIAVAYAEPKRQKAKPGLILFIHGDGPGTKNGDEGYYPAWETLAEENYISVSWDKAGIGESTGNWLDQDMTDRQLEAEKVLKWALETFDVDPEKVGVWGASQGGWVITKLLNNNKNVKFAIGVAPAVNWLRQGEYNTIADLSDRGVSEADIKTSVADGKKINDYLKRDDYQGYLASQLDQEPMSKDRWQFVVKNMNLDNTAELKKINKPYYLLIGDHDINVDVAETEAIYRETIPAAYLSVYHVKNATHRMVKPRHQRDNWQTIVEAVFNPRQIFSPAYFDALKESVSLNSKVSD